MVMMRSKGGCGICFVGNILRNQPQTRMGWFVGNETEGDVPSRYLLISYPFSAVSKLVPLDVDYEETYLPSRSCRLDNRWAVNESVRNSYCKG